MDKILLEGIRLEVRVGVTEEERSVPQHCGLDLSLYVKLGPAGKSGDLDKSVNYATVFRCIEEVCSSRAYVLLEEIAEQICSEILGRFRIKEISVKVRKLHPFSPKLEAVGVEVHRTRKQMKRDYCK
jgi:dihydroneopterin aldolase